MHRIPRGSRQTFQGIFDRLAAAGEVNREFDGVAFDDARVVQLHFVALKIPVDHEAELVALDFSVRERRLTHNLAFTFAGEFRAVYFEREGTLDGAVRAFRSTLPLPADIGGEGGDREE